LKIKPGKQMSREKDYKESYQHDRNGRNEITPYIDRLERETKKKFTGPEPLAKMKYEDEIRAKDRAFSAYWNDITGSCSAGVIVPSPMPRKYRTTTKRRVHVSQRGILLSSDESSRTDKPSLLEPDSHSDIYIMIAELLNTPVNKHIGKFLNFVIIRGDYESHTVIFNIKRINSDVVKGYTGIAEKLQAQMAKVTGAYLFHDPDGSKYYLNTSADVDGLRLKRLFGNRMLTLRAGGILYKYSPDGFSQVNLSICDDMLRTAESLLSHQDGGRLLDLYSGYGFFSCYLAGGYSEVTGIDFAESSIDSARENMKMIKTKAKWAFHARRIDIRSLRDILPEPGIAEYVILDPPRNGTAPGVIATIAERDPELVLHIFCGVETIPAEIEQWRHAGYQPVKCIPLDMFPGTPDVEVMVLLKRTHLPKTSSWSKSGRKEM
jgi:tRNA/tmRNA/rRNA uracil-C5-methylase (TrmA/RlmC/RlmD family)